MMTRQAITKKWRIDEPHRNTDSTRPQRDGFSVLPFLPEGREEMKPLLVCFSVALVAVAAFGHDMFLVLPDHDFPEGSRITVALFNGTFDTSENTIDRERMIDVRVIDGANRGAHPSADQWRDEGKTSYLDFQSGPPGTYVVGVSTAPRMIELTAEEFNGYLAHDGVSDVLEARRRDGALDQSAAERYSKHVKTILQVGGSTTESYGHRLGYPVEIVPLANPGDLASGLTLDVLVLAEGEPVSGQLVYASYEGFHSHDDSGAHREAATLRTDEKGVARIELTRSGRWYVRLIRMLPSEDEGVDYESNWATLTFEVR
jgi:uncharacterized GH25 family protein